MSYRSINPFTEALGETFNEHTDEQVRTLLAAAQTTYERDWSRRTVSARSAVVKKAAVLLRRDAERFATLATLEMGKLLSEAKGEVALSADILDYYGDHAERFLAPKTIEVSAGEAVVEQASLGVIFCIEPWNFPYYQLARVAGPNLAAGNTLLVKHAPSVPQCALAFEHLFLEAGAPRGAYTNLFLSNDQCATLIRDPRVRGVALTGSERAGAAVAAEAGKVLKKSTMELGGSDAFIVLDDANLDTAVQWGLWGRLNNAGQCCVAAKRFILDETIADEFLRRFSRELGKLRAGDPMDAATTMAPLSSAPALDHVLTQIATAVTGGAQLLMGGKRLDRPGLFLEPTILSDLKPGNPAYYEEFFAPVALIFRVKDEDEAVKVANDSPFGLGGSVITADVERGKRVARRMDTGMVFVNQATWTAPELPFGGVKNSGYGRELSDLGIGEFVNKKLIRVA